MMRLSVLFWGKKKVFLIRFFLLGINLCGDILKGNLKKM